MWRANSPKTHPPYQTPCWIHTRDGKEYQAKLNDNGRWKVYGKRKYVENNDVVEWRLALDI